MVKRKICRDQEEVVEESLDIEYAKVWNLLENFGPHLDQIERFLERDSLHSEDWKEKELRPQISLEYEEWGPTIHFGQQILF